MSFLAPLVVILTGRRHDGGPPGSNDFSAVVGPAIKHSGDGTVHAVGNTWAHYPPTAGVDYEITGAGTIDTQ